MEKISQPTVLIVFLNWNGKKDTFELLESLKKITYKNYDIIIVDNGSTDGTEKEFKKLFPNAIFDKDGYPEKTFCGKIK